MLPIPFDALSTSVAEVDEARVLLIQGGNLRHIVVGESEVEDVEVLCHAFFVSRFGDGYDANKTSARNIKHFMA